MYFSKTFYFIELWLLLVLPYDEMTIMASIAQEESRKVSERVKWGIHRKMEDGWVYGYSKMLGYRTENGTLKVVPEEAEIVKRIFNSYVYEGKGCHTIANELNAAGFLSVNGKMWREDGVCRILKNDKYVGDLTQWKHYSTDFLTKKVVQNNGDNPDAPLITIPEHHLMKKKNYCYSFDNEHFHNDDDLDNAKTQEEAEAIAQQLMQDNSSDNIWIGTSCSISAEDVVPEDLAEDVIYKIGEYVYEELCGEAAEDYLTDIPESLEKELDESLRTVIKKWIAKHQLEPSFFYVTDIKEIRREQ